MKNNIRKSHGKNLQTNTEYSVLEQVSLGLLFKKWKANFQRIFAVIQFYFHRITFGVFKSVKLPWFRLAVLAFGVFIFLKKDLHFQIQMKAPFAPKAQAASYSTSEQLSMNPFAQKPETTTTAPATINQYGFSQEQVEQYIKRFGKVAIIEQERFGVPASIKMAQAILASQAGSQAPNNNHFGQVFSKQSFESAWESWRAHSLLFSAEQYPFQQLLQHERNYKKWAKGLEELRYTQQANYAQKIIDIIEKYELFRLDEMSME